MHTFLTLSVASSVFVLLWFTLDFIAYLISCTDCLWCCCGCVGSAVWVKCLYARRRAALLCYTKNNPPAPTAGSCGPRGQTPVAPSVYEGGRDEPVCLFGIAADYMKTKPLNLWGTIEGIKCKGLRKTDLLITNLNNEGVWF